MLLVGFRFERLWLYCELMVIRIFSLCLVKKVGFKRSRGVVLERIRLQENFWQQANLGVFGIVSIYG
jgi:hypothetical protein